MDLRLKFSQHNSSRYKVYSMLTGKWNGFAVSVFVCVFQYSEKEDKYEEEIKVLSDKLKEVKKSINETRSKISCPFSYWMCFFNSFNTLIVFIRPRPVQSLQRGRWPNWKNLSMTWKVWKHSLVLWVNLSFRWSQKLNCFAILGSEHEDSANLTTFSRSASSCFQNTVAFPVMSDDLTTVVTM